jgi:hypothetical protein
MNRLNNSDRTRVVASFQFHAVSFFMRTKFQSSPLAEHEKLYRSALEQLEDWVKRIRRGDMGDFSPMMDEIFDTEELIRKIREGYTT